MKKQFGDFIVEINYHHYIRDEIRNPYKSVTVLPYGKAKKFGVTNHLVRACDGAFSPHNDYQIGSNYDMASCDDDSMVVLSKKGAFKLNPYRGFTTGCITISKQTGQHFTSIPVTAMAHCSWKDLYSKKVGIEIVQARLFASLSKGYNSIHRECVERLILDSNHSLPFPIKPIRSSEHEIYTGYLAKSVNDLHCALTYLSDYLLPSYENYVQRLVTAYEKDNKLEENNRVARVLNVIKNPHERFEKAWWESDTAFVAYSSVDGPMNTVVKILREAMAKKVNI